AFEGASRRVAFQRVGAERAFDPTHDHGRVQAVSRHVADDQPQLPGRHGKRVIPVAANQTVLGRDVAGGQLHPGQPRQTPGLPTGTRTPCQTSSSKPHAARATSSSEPPLRSSTAAVSTSRTERIRPSSSERRSSTSRRANDVSVTASTLRSCSAASGDFTAPASRRRTNHTNTPPYPCE